MPARRIVGTRVPPRDVHLKCQSRTEEREEEEDEAEEEGPQERERSKETLKVICRCLLERPCLSIKTLHPTRVANSKCCAVL